MNKEKDKKEDSNLLENASVYLSDGLKHLDKLYCYLQYDIPPTYHDLKHTQELIQGALSYIGDNIDLALEEIARAENSYNISETLIERFIDETKPE